MFVVTYLLVISCLFLKIKSCLTNCKKQAEAPVLWPPHAKSWLIGRDSDAGMDWGQKGTTEDEMAEWHHRLDGRESEWTLGVGDGQGGLVCCDSWGCRESDTTERLNWTELYMRKHSEIPHCICTWFEWWDSAVQAWVWCQMGLGIWNHRSYWILQVEWVQIVRGQQAICGTPSH